MSAPIELIVAAFDDEHKAGAALQELKTLQHQGLVSIVNAAVMVKSKDGRASIKETEDVAAPAGAVFGAIVGGLVGLLGGPAGVIVGAAAGAATGGLAAHKIDMGFDNHELKDIQASLPAGSSAVIALVSLDWVERVVQALEGLEAQLWRRALREETLDNLGETRMTDEGGPAPKDEAPTAATPASEAIIEGKATPPASPSAPPSAPATPPAAVGDTSK